MKTLVFGAILALSSTFAFAADPAAVGHDHAQHRVGQHFVPAFKVAAVASPAA